MDLARRELRRFCKVPIGDGRGCAKQIRQPAIRRRCERQFRHFRHFAGRRARRHSQPDGQRPHRLCRRAAHFVRHDRRRRVAALSRTQAHDIRLDQGVRLTQRFNVAAINPFATPLGNGFVTSPCAGARKLRPLARTSWWSEMDSNQRYLSPYCLARSQRRPYHRKSTSRLEDRPRRVERPEST
jgi:hypothetical protein